MSNDVTLDSRTATLCGYTHQELTTAFAEHLDGVDLAEMQRGYNGYHFRRRRCCSRPAMPPCINGRCGQWLSLPAGFSQSRGAGQSAASHPAPRFPNIPCLTSGYF
ncbi:MAG: AAA family ATPase [Candidatus Competibacteraceae bacterium]|nr:AAA family ATPase [Candidatus Contendobacter odensis]MBK8536667.1 AAA family ATPase [Candidatus Competibacteraceae bacterium]MBK8752208.1 AAA family ATPase [Candidatus Competibacteraceae bacterium]